MKRICLVTTVTDDEPLKWGLDIGRIAVPTALLCNAEMARVLRHQKPPAGVSILDAEVPRPLAVRDRLAGLQRVCTDPVHDADLYYWIDIELLYQHLSFEFLYSDLLLRAFRRLAPHAAYFPMPGYEPRSFFGGSRASVARALERGDDPAGGLFEDPTGPPPVDPLFPHAFPERPAVDLNLNLAAVIEEPVLHIAGDSHVLNCFTLNRAIGCRTNVLVPSGEVCAIPVPYAYHFSHHLGGRTMHFAGRRGALLGEAKAFGLKGGDAVVWVFGEIDVRSHILRLVAETGRPLEELIDDLAHDYVRGILEVEGVYPGLRSVVFPPIPPLDNPNYESVNLPVFGTIDERIAATRQIGATLHRLCDLHGILYLDVLAPYETARGDLQWDRSDHFCHISSTFQGPILEALYRLLAEPRRFRASPSA